jgi:hypothetical protein
MALPASEDTGMLLALNAVADGWFSAEPGTIYRKWHGQLTASDIYTSGIGRRERMHLVEERAQL